MSFSWKGQTFEGLFASASELKTVSGIYVIWCVGKNGMKPLDVGETEDVQFRVTNHDRADCWREHCSDKIMYSAIYILGLDEDGRRKIESRIKSLLGDIPCGDR